MINAIFRPRPFFFFFFLQAFAADPVEQDAAILNPPVKLICCQQFDLVAVDKIIHIEYIPAAPADKVIVRMRVTVVVFRPCSCCDLLGFPKLNQQRQIPVNRPETDIRINIPDILVDHVRRRVIFPVPKILGDRVSLTTMLQPCHMSHPFLRNDHSFESGIIIITEVNIALPQSFVNTYF